MRALSSSFEELEVLVERVRDVLSDGERVEQGRALEHHRHALAHLAQLLLVHLSHVLVVQQHLPESDAGAR